LYAPGLEQELEWKLVYVGSADDEKYDQELDCILVGPVQIGKNKFVFQAPAPDPTTLLTKDICGVTIILLTCSYKEKEFIRIGYYVNNDYEDPALLETPPEAPIIDKIARNILATQPRVTRFEIPWDSAQTNEPKFDYKDLKRTGSTGNASSGSSDNSNSSSSSSLDVADEDLDAMKDEDEKEEEEADDEEEKETVDDVAMINELEAPTNLESANLEAASSNLESASSSSSSSSSSSGSSTSWPLLAYATIDLLLSIGFTNW